MCQDLNVYGSNDDCSLQCNGRGVRSNLHFTETNRRMSSNSKYKKHVKKLKISNLSFLSYFCRFVIIKNNATVSLDGHLLTVKSDILNCHPVIKQAFSEKHV